MFIITLHTIPSVHRVFQGNSHRCVCMLLTLPLSDFPFRKQAEESLDEAYHSLGSVEDIFAVFKEAENIFIKARKPYSAVKAVSSNASAAAPSSTANGSSTSNWASAASGGGGAIAKTMTSNTSSHPVKAAATSAAVAKPSVGHSSNSNQFGSYKTRICEHWKNTRKCPHGVYCMFAHGNGELRQVPVSQVGDRDTATPYRTSVSPPLPRSVFLLLQNPSTKPNPNTYYKVIICKNFEAGGNCPWGKTCIFAHGKEELRPSTFSADVSMDWFCCPVRQRSD